jgi:hypothetical protein
MYAWAYGAIYGCQQRMDRYKFSLPAGFAAIPVLYTVTESPLESLLESLLERLLESLVESLHETASLWDE